MDFLTEIMSLKRARVEASKQVLGVGILKTRAYDVRASSAQHSLHAALARPGVNLIAEIKRASPSLGVIRDDVDVAALGAIYELSGAAAVSVLTEEDRFMGSLNDLRTVRASVKIPLLRKDFIFDEYQVYEAADARADAVLLIVAALDDELLSQLRILAEEQLGMDALVEVHTGEELQRALNTGARIIGVNNRNLKTFEVSLDTSFELIARIPNDVLAVAESGLRTARDISRCLKSGYKGFLVGETLMRSGDPGVAIKSLLTPLGVPAA